KGPGRCRRKHASLCLGRTGGGGSGGSVAGGQKRAAAVRGVPPVVTPRREPLERWCRDRRGSGGRDESGFRLRGRLARLGPVRAGGGGRGRGGGGHPGPVR